MEALITQPAEVRRLELKNVYDTQNCCVAKQQFGQKQ
jgi:hypothetical protein